MASPAPVFFLPLVACPGRICMHCDHAIARWGVRLGDEWIMAFAHPGCALDLALEMPELAG